MVFIPFFYFLLVFFYIMRQNGWDVCAYVAFLYVLTSLFSVLIHILDYQIVVMYEESLIPTIIYCTLLTVAILPLYFFKSNRIEKVTCRSSLFIDCLVYFYFISFLVMLLAYKNDIIFRFTYGNLRELRALTYQGEGLGFTSYPKYIELFLIPMRTFANMSYVMIFIFFFSITYLQKSRYYNLMAIIGSLPCILIGIIGIDRSRTFYWILFFGLAGSLFWKNMSKKTKKIAVSMTAVFFLLIVSYMAIVTISRFGDTGLGGASSIIEYAGQAYIHFCYFWDRYDSPEGFTTKYLFPAIHHFIIGDYDGGTAYQQEMTSKSHMECGVFYTYLGNFIISSGKIGPFMITFVYLFLCSLVMRRRSSVVSFETLLKCLFVMFIPVAGCISYIYTSYNATMCAILLIVGMNVLRSRKRVYIKNQ